MKIVYIAGPYMATSYLDIDANIARAREAATEVVSAGAGFICPHMNSAHFEEITPYMSEIFWKDLDLELLRKAADAIYMMRNWSHSAGAREEHKVAEAMKIPIFYQIEGNGKLKEWANV